MVIPIFRFFYSAISKLLYPWNFSWRTQFLQPSKDWSTYPSMAKQFRQGSAATRGKLEPGRTELQLLCAGGSVAAQEGERELNPGVTSGLSWSWEHCSHTSVFSSEFLSESFEWSWARLLGLRRAATSAPLCSGQELLVAGAVLGGWTMLLWSWGEKMEFDYAGDVLPQRTAAAWLDLVSPALVTSSLECQRSVKNRTDGKCQSDQIPLSAGKLWHLRYLWNEAWRASGLRCKTWLTCDLAPRKTEIT